MAALEDNRCAELSNGQIGETQCGLHLKYGNPTYVICRATLCYVFTNRCDVTCCSNLSLVSENDHHVET